jgi:hypothetical protein
LTVIALINVELQRQLRKSVGSRKDEARACTYDYSYVSIKEYGNPNHSLRKRLPNNPLTSVVFRTIWSCKALWLHTASQPLDAMPLSVLIRSGALRLPPRPKRLLPAIGFVESAMVNEGPNRRSSAWNSAAEIRRGVDAFSGMMSPHSGVA